MKKFLEGWDEKPNSEESGVIGFNYKADSVAITWRAGPKNLFDLKTLLNNSVEDIRSQFDIDILQTSYAQTKLGHDLIYAHFKIFYDNQQKYGVFAVWYCDINEKFYGMRCYASKDVILKFQHSIDSFICH